MNKILSYLHPVQVAIINILPPSPRNYQGFWNPSHRQRRTCYTPRRRKRKPSAAPFLPFNNIKQRHIRIRKAFVPQKHRGRYSTFFHFISHHCFRIVQLSPAASKHWEEVGDAIGAGEADKDSCGMQKKRHKLSYMGKQTEPKNLTGYHRMRHKIKVTKRASTSHAGVPVHDVENDVVAHFAIRAALWGASEVSSNIGWESVGRHCGNHVCGIDAAIRPNGLGI